MWSVRRRLAIPLIIASMAAAGSTGRSYAEQSAAIHPVVFACPGAMIEVRNASITENALVCDAAFDAIRRLDRCAIIQRRPLFIEVSGLVRNPFGREIFGQYDARRGIISIAQLVRARALAEDMPYRTLPSAVFYRSLVVHEVVHVIMQQNYERQPNNRAAHEYPAYALQFASLPPPIRDGLLGEGGDHPAADKILFNDIILGMDPFRFATLAYRHFIDAEDGCAHLQGLLKGPVEFIIDLPF